MVLDGQLVRAPIEPGGGRPRGEGRSRLESAIQLLCGGWCEARRKSAYLRGSGQRDPAIAVVSLGGTLWVRTSRQQSPPPS